MDRRVEEPRTPDLLGRHDHWQQVDRSGIGAGSQRRSRAVIDDLHVGGHCVIDIVILRSRSYRRLAPIVSRGN
jgi:hypothetical protein